MIDIIIPAYNAHDTISKTLMSLCIQTCKDKFDVTIVNDCSNRDYSEEIKIFSKYINVKEIKLDKNSGPGIARQVGIENTSNPFIMFLDSDDVFINCFSIQRIVDKIKKHPNVEHIDTPIIIEYERNIIDMVEDYNYCLHGKCYKRKFIEDNNIKFNNTRRSEDASFNSIYLIKNPLRGYIKEPIYLYRYCPTSIVHRPDFRQNDNYLKDFVTNVFYVIECTKNCPDPSLFHDYIYNCFLYFYDEFHFNYYDEILYHIYKPLIKYYEEARDYLKIDESKVKSGRFKNMKINFKDFIFGIKSA